MSYAAIQSESPKYPPQSLSLFLLCFFISLFCTVWASYALMNGDMASITMFSVEMLKGKHLYTDLITSQPPLIMYICMIPVLFHQITGLSIPDAFSLFLFILYQGCVLFSWRISRNNQLCKTTQDSYLILCAMYCGIFLLPIIGQRYLHAFGQRENMMCAMMMPYLMLTLNRLQGASGTKKQQVAVGVLGAIGFLIKPQFLLFFALSELFLMAVRRRFFYWSRIDSWIIAISALLYAGFIFLFTPDYLPLIRRLLLDYSGYEIGFASVIFAALFTMFVPLLILYSQRNSTHFLEILYLIVLIAAANVLYILPKLPYYYHALPVYFFSLFLFVFARLATKTKLVAKGITFFLLFAFISFIGVALIGISLIDAGFLRYYILPAAVLPAVFYIIARIIPEGKTRVFMVLPQYFLIMAALTTPVDVEHYIGRRDQILQEAAIIAPYKTVVGFNSDNLLYFPLMLYTQAQWDMTLVYLEYLPVSYAQWKNSEIEVPYHHPQEMDENERFFHEKTIHDLARLPDIIIVDEGLNKAGFGNHVTFDYIHYFMQDPRFKDIWSHYELMTRFHRTYNNITRQLEDSTDAIYRRKDLANSH